MRVLLDLPSVASVSDTSAGVARALELVIAANRRLVRRGLPWLYRSGVRFRAEPWAGHIEQFCDASVVLKRGWGDCAQLCAWRVAELRESGKRANVHIYCRVTPQARLFHVQVRHPPSARYPSGWIEDPSRMLES